MSGTSPEEDEMSTLLNDPRFQNLLAKAEAHQWKFRPRESERLEAAGELMPALQLRTKDCWDLLKSCRKSGMTLTEAQEVAYPKILVGAELR